ncbi:MAG: Asp23/Gls24 family envelope stress response protein [Streptosporangiaceae bacterium]|jgi:uncharacterized alkaline shock family protein YloU
MSLAPAIPAPPIPGSSPSSADVTLADPAERGRTVLAPQVVDKIAAQAATEIDGISGLQRRIAGRSVGSERVRAESDLDGQVVAVRLQLAVAFPAPLLELTRRVRQHVTGQIQTLCSLQVDHVDITVAALRADASQRRRVQ